KTNSCTVNVHGTYLLYASNRIREMQIELRELRQWTSLISDSHRPSKWDGIRGRREWCTGQSLGRGCMSLVKWALGPSLGEGLQVFGEMVTVKRLHGIETSLMTCIQSMPSNITVAQNTCYTAGVHYLEPGSTLELCIPRKSAGLVLKPHTTFLGTE
uniref:THD domain-containing protein n=1 Tax=Oncorhynchus mykiss TaxID=8022 RepID=A0A8C7Q063_ONCMY